MYDVFRFCLFGCFWFNFGILSNFFPIFMSAMGIGFGYTKLGKLKTVVNSIQKYMLSMYMLNNIAHSKLLYFTHGELTKPPAKSYSVRKHAMGAFSYVVLNF